MVKSIFVFEGLAARWATHDWGRVKSLRGFTLQLLRRDSLLVLRSLVLSTLKNARVREEPGLLLACS